MDLQTVDQWVEYIQTLHFREIDMSLERVRKVLSRIRLEERTFKVVTIAGTNGKGSVAELTSSLLRTSGLKVGKFSSPHLVRFNERIEINGTPIDDDSLIRSFKNIESRRDGIGITYFEYCFLLAIDCFQSTNVDVVVLEVGLGGRLDAVNAIDADVTVITSISFDHTDWLGNTLEKIGFEKAGIARPDKPCILGMKNPQESIINHLNSVGAVRKQVGRDFDVIELDTTFKYVGQKFDVSDLPQPFDQNGVQLVNGALSVQAVIELQDLFGHLQVDFHAGISNARLQARCQVLRREPLVIVDVAHNVDSIRTLLTFLEKLEIKGRLVAICGMLQDKQIGDCIHSLMPLVDDWNFVTINNPRGASSAKLNDKYWSFTESIVSKKAPGLFDSPAQAYSSIIESLKSDDCLVVFGSFFVAGDILKYVKPEAALSECKSDTYD